MTRKSLEKSDKARLQELVEIYATPKRPFIVTGNGGIKVKGESRIFGWLTGQSDDFSSIVLVVTDKLLENKGTIEYVQGLCSDAVSALVTTNKRDYIIKKLYSAHLVDEEPERSDRKEHSSELHLEFEVERERPTLSRKIFVGRSPGISSDLVAMLNKSNYIVFEDK